MKNNFYITTPIYYVNDSPHLGHAYTTIASDVMARFKRLCGDDVFFLTGTDEHGQKIDKAAKEAGTDPQKFTDIVSQRFQALVKCGDSENLLNTTNNDFIRTTEDRHKKACVEIWNKMQGNGHIYLDKYAGWYSVRDEAYYQEGELVGGKAPTGADVEWIEEESFFFDLSKWQQKLLDFYKANPDFIIPKSRYNEVVRFVEGGLKDLSISRTNFNWGIPVPENNSCHPERSYSAVEGSHLKLDSSTTLGMTPTINHHVMYVWVDALTNYLTALGYPDLSAENFKKFWQADSVFHVVGKDIIRFHAVYWPAFLMAANLPLPKQIIAHGWWMVEGEKMSKSLGNVIAPRDLINDYGLDQVRYYLLKAMPFGNDGDLVRSQMVETVNADLANNFGNLAQRTLSMIAKNFEGRIPKPTKIEDFGWKEHFDKIQTEMKAFQFQNALNEIVLLGNKANEYVDKQAPWALKKEGKIEEMGGVLYNLAEVVRKIFILLQPFCPAACEKLLDQLLIPKDKRNFEHLLPENFKLLPDIGLPSPTGVFPRIEIKPKNEDLKVM